MLITFRRTLFSYLFINCLGIYVTFAQSPDAAWIRIGIGAQQDVPFSTATDQEGNVYMAGYFQSASLSFDGQTVSNASEYAVFLVKYSAAGNVLWVRAAEEESDFSRVSVAVGPSGEVYLAGSFYSSSISFGMHSLSNSGSENGEVYLVRYNSDGEVQWATSASGIGNDELSAIAVDASGNVFLTGFYSSPSVSFGSQVLTKESGIPYGDYYNVFTAKYNANGEALWARGSHGNAFDRSYGLSADQAGNVYVTGWFQSTNFRLETNSLTNNGKADVFVVKYNAEGELQWTQSYGSSEDDMAIGIATDENEDVYVTGYYDSPSLVMDDFTLMNNSTSNDIFVFKTRSSDGEVEWASSYGGSGSDLSMGIVTDGQGKIVVYGGFLSPALVFGTDELFNAQDSEGFVSMFDEEGNIHWAGQTQSNGQSVVMSVAFDRTGQIYLSGMYKGSSLSYETLSVSTNNLDDPDVFLIRLGGLPTDREEPEQEVFSLFPNPCRDKLYIQEASNRPGTLNVYTLEGALRYTSPINGDTIAVDVQTFPHGMYVCEVNYGNRIRREKFIVE